MKKDIMKYIFVIAVIMLIGIKHISLEVYAYTDSSLYGEKLYFDEEGNLIMTTHDKKATTNIKYKTVGWVIKRYDMPMNAQGQQFVIIPIGDNAEYKDDADDNAYVYCYYKGNKDKIANEINKCSSQWKMLLYKYGDYVYIDEIMTVVENGNPLGGLNYDGTAYGEIYYDYAGISNARAWAAKENLRTHFDKQVYFPQQIEEKHFGYSYTVLSQIKRSHKPYYAVQIGQGNKFSSTYEIESGVPTGESLYINGYADKYGYNITFNQVSVNLRLPVKLVIHYTLKWKAYDGSIVSEEKDVVSWYYVNRIGSYYTVENVDIDYLSELSIDNYAFENNQITKKIYDCNPTIKKIHFKEYYNHIISPDYKDVYYIDGGTITQYDKNGIKPDIPDINRQSVVESFVGQCEVMNDYFALDNVVILDNNPVEKNGPAPSNNVYCGKKQIYYTGLKIPNDKKNSMDNISSGYISYKDYLDNKITKYKVSNLKKVSIHTPVCIDGKIQGDRENFKIVAEFSGEHRNIKGYGYKDYESMCDIVYIKFSEDIIKNGEILKQDLWTEYNTSDEYSVIDNEKEIKAELVAYAKNHIALDEDISLHTQNIANLDINNYAANKEFVISFEESEESKKLKVVGTH